MLPEDTKCAERTFDFLTMCCLARCSAEPCEGYADLIVSFLDEDPEALQPFIVRLRDRIVNQCASVKLEM